jgi:redox-sensitive bicupin YhaK (pirin superfamily)
MGPAHFKPGEGIDVRPHPHIGLSTITYLFEGEIIHRDSLGSLQAITSGDVNWMTAGRGIVHSERSGDKAREEGQRLHGLQVWVGLPEESEDIDPEFFHFDISKLPLINEDGMQIRVIVGTAFGEESPVKTYSPLFYLDVNLSAGKKLVVPVDYRERAIHVVGGKVSISDTDFNMFNMAVCEETAEISIHAVENSRLVIFGGEPIPHRHVWWNFVSSSREKIERAKQDWKAGRFDKVPGEHEFIPLPDDS